MRRGFVRTLSAAAPLTVLGIQALGAQSAPPVAAAPSPTERRQFLTCPIVRDTKTQPCWLAEYQGELYYLGQQSGVAGDFYPVGLRLFS